MVDSISSREPSPEVPQGEHRPSPPSSRMNPLEKSYLVCQRPAAIHGRVVLGSRTDFEYVTGVLVDGHTYGVRRRTRDRLRDDTVPCGDI